MLPYGKVIGISIGREIVASVSTYNDPLGVRLQDPNIKSVVLYLLS